MIVFDLHGGVAFVWSGGGGGYAGVGASGGVVVQYTTAETVEDLEGPVVQIGASAGEGLSGGVEWVASKGYQGVNVNIGVGANAAPFGLEEHAVLETAKVTVLRSGVARTDVSTTEPTEPRGDPVTKSTAPTVASSASNAIASWAYERYLASERTKEDYQQYLDAYYTELYASGG
jgi:hypothetical protein